MGMSERSDSGSPRERGLLVSFSSRHSPMAVVMVTNRSTRTENMEQM